MKKTLFKIFVLIFAVLLVFSFAACGSYDSGNFEPVEDGSEIVNNDVNRKIVYTVRIGIDSGNVKETKKSITDKNTALGGYVEEANEQYKGDKIESVYLVLRVPTEKLDELITSVEEGGNVYSKRIETTDITESYVRAQAKKTALEERRALLNAMLEDDALSPSDRITVINEISSVNAELLSAELSINSYDSMAAYSTVYVNVYEKRIALAPIGIIILMFLGFGAVVAVVVLAVNLFTAKQRLKEYKKKEQING